jgi:hypothetical protein
MTAARVRPGRFTAATDQSLVVFAIGMRINRRWAIHRWLRPTINTARMWWYLQRHRPAGYRNGYLFVYAWGVGMMQYWSDFDSLETFSHDREQPHLAAWRQLAAQTATDTTFGYWHETYRVEPGTSEAIYGSMPIFGLAAATEHDAVAAATETARSRIDG